MSERPDDTTQTNDGSPPERERQPQNYYYDDGTGYEVYRPETDEEEREDDTARR
jgi:hypothetical protein